MCDIIRRIEEFDFDSVNLHDSKTSNSKNYELDLSVGHSFSPLMVYFDFMNIVSCHQVSYGNYDVTFDLRKKTSVKDFISSFNKKTIELIKHKGILKSLGMTNPVFKTLIIDYVDNVGMETYECMKVKMVLNGKYNTDVFSNQKQISVDCDTVKKYVNNHHSGRIILELYSITFDTDTRSISVNTLIRQIETKTMCPVRIEKLPYSFNKFDNIDNDVNNDNDDNVEHRKLQYESDDDDDDNNNEQHKKDDDVYDEDISNLYELEEKEKGDRDDSSSESSSSSSSSSESYVKDSSSDSED